MSASPYQSHSVVIGRAFARSQRAVCNPERMYRRRSVALPGAHTILDTPRPVSGNQAYKCTTNSLARLHLVIGMCMGLYCPMTDM